MSVRPPEFSAIWFQLKQAVSVTYDILLPDNSAYKPVFTFQINPTLIRKDKTNPDQTPNVSAVVTIGDVRQSEY
jgi:hypothetical protein